MCVLNHSSNQRFWLTCRPHSLFLVAYCSLITTPFVAKKITCPQMCEWHHALCSNSIVAMLQTTCLWQTFHIMGFLPWWWILPLKSHVHVEHLPMVCCFPKVDCQKQLDFEKRHGLHHIFQKLQWPSYVFAFLDQG